MGWQRADLAAEVLEEFVDASRGTASEGRAPQGKFSRVSMKDAREKRRRSRPSQANPNIAPRGTLCAGHCKMPLSDNARGRGFKMCRDCRFQLGLVPTPGTSGTPRNLEPRPRNIELAGKLCPMGCGRKLKSTSKSTGCRNCRRRAGENRDGHAPALVTAAELPRLLQPESVAAAAPTFDPTTLTNEQLAACVREANRRIALLRGKAT